MDTKFGIKIPPKLYLGLLAIPLLIYVVYSLGVNLGVIDSEEPELKPESKAEIKDIKQTKKALVKKDLDLIYKPEKFDCMMLHFVWFMCCHRCSNN